ncbi:MAG: FAD-binding oxidoreductase [Propionibacterium sp.]|nr:FAD-binding oxidoreductase [Propionibacterium sp.]
MSNGMQRSADALTRLALSHDASRFLEIPREVIIASNTADIRQLFAEATHHRRHLTLRGGGTSLSGQSISDDMLVDVRRRFRDIEVLDDGARVRVGAGASVAQVNARLRRYGRRIGPDPASAQTATVGGVVATNATGKLCGIADDVFHTVDSMVVVLPSGRVVDTADPDADITLTWEEPTLAGGLAILRRRLRDDAKSLSEVSRLWGMRNAMGYHLRALTDFSRPSDILRQLMVGSEGTLGFVAEVTLHTVPLLPHKRVDLAIFSSIEEAVETASELVEHGFEVLELFDVDALRVVQDVPNAHPALAGRELNGEAALLIELHAPTEDELADRGALAQPYLDALPEVHRIDTSPKAPLWRLHHGIYTEMSKSRPRGTSILMEDFSVPREKIVDTIHQLDNLFDRFQYGRSAITGHLTDCTLHFMLTENFEDEASLRRFRRFVQAFVRLILSQGGVLKAQHGTGRVMAPFLERQVGIELYDVMREIKHLLDPAGILSPGVMFNDNPNAHVTHLKLMPTVEEPVDKCVECGLCENVCPSTELTLSPRNRIVLRRELAVRKDDEQLLDAVFENYQYAAVDTCSTAGMCELACPLGIDTGELVRQQRAAVATDREQRVWDRAARNWGTFTRIGSGAMTAAQHLKPLARFVTKLGRNRLGGDQVWGYSDDMPRGSGLRRRPARERAAKRPVAAYFPGCTQTLLASRGEGVFAAFNELSTRAGVPVTLLNASKLCCGIPWKMRGLSDGYATMSAQVSDTLPRDTLVVTDSSACAVGLSQMIDGWDDGGPETIDVVRFAAEQLLPELTITAKLGSLLLYPTCSTSHLQDTTALHAIASAIAEEVVVPDSWVCCGAFGDTGLLHPELPQAATRMAVDEIAERRFDGYTSTSRTCEVAMSKVTEEPFVHILESLARATR